MKDLHEATAEMFAEAQAMVEPEPYQDRLHVDSGWLRHARGQSKDKHRKRDERAVDVVKAEICDIVRCRLCACGCGQRVSGRRKYASKECRKKVIRERDRVRKAEQRADALRQIREAEGVVERVCACGCGRVFPVGCGVGREKKFATLACRVKAAQRRLAERLLKWTGKRGAQ